MAGLEDLSTAEQVCRQIRRLYGRDLPVAGGVVHVAAVWRQPGGALRVLKINEATPRSATDFFVLNLGRARSDAIVTTGRILREEPAVTHDLQGAGSLPAALAAWRSFRTGGREPPLLLVLTSGRRLDLDHPALHGWARPLIFTSSEAAEGLLRRLPEGSRLEVAGVESSSLRAALAYLEARGCRTVSVEAGPSTALDLYRAPPRVDELLLSVFEGEELAAASVGPPFLSAKRLESLFPSPAGGAPVAEASGRWRFYRYLAFSGPTPPPTPGR